MYKEYLYIATEMWIEATMHGQVAKRLAALYEVPFGGKEHGRFQISMKLLRQIMGRRRLYEDDIRAIGRELLELGYVLIDMETYFCVLHQRTLANYRRVNAEHLHDGSGAATAHRDAPRGDALQ
jgi:hypothetical protein